VTRTGEAVGRVRTSSSNDVYPPATGLGVEVGQVYGSMSQIHTLTQDRITLARNKVDLRGFERRDGEVLLHTDVLAQPRRRH
jgi:hypothetical protein